MKRRLPRMLALGALAGLTAPTGAQTDRDDGHTASPSVTLDQVSIENAGHAADLDVAQPARLPLAAAVTSSEVSNRAEGLALAVAPVNGTDRCDADAGAATTSLCRQRLENRASQYARPRAASVTPEARLLLLLNPNGTLAANDARGRQMGLDGTNGPAEQLAGALQDGTASRDSDVATQTPADANAAPAPPPTIVVMPPK